jgi:hypothetical protein
MVVPLVGDLLAFLGRRGDLFLVLLLSGDLLSLFVGGAGDVVSISVMLLFSLLRLSWEAACSPVQMFSVMMAELSGGGELVCFCGVVGD